MRVRRIVIAIASALALAAGITPPPVWAADDYLVVADPGPRQELTQEPGWVTLVFKTEASATYAAIVVHNSAGENVATGALIVEGTNVTTQLLGDLPEGTYTVIYRTEDENGEPRGGAYQFSYGPGTWTDVDDEWIGEEEQPPEIDSPGPPASPIQTETPTPAPTPTPTPEPTDSQTATPASPTAEPSPSQGPAPISSEPNLAGWLVGAAAVLVAGAAAGVAVSRRRRGGPTPPASRDQDGAAPPEQDGEQG